MTNARANGLLAIFNCDTWKMRKLIKCLNQCSCFAGVFLTKTETLNFIFSVQDRRQNGAAGGSKNHKERHISKYSVGCMQQLPRKISLAICKLLSHVTRPRKLYTHINAEPAEHRHLMFCNLGKAID